MLNNNLLTFAASGGAPTTSNAMSSNHNSVLCSNSDNLTGVRVGVDVQEDIVCQSTNGQIVGFSIQLNCYSLKDATPAWQQFVIAVLGAQVIAAINYWDAYGSPLVKLQAPLAQTQYDATLPAGAQLLFTLIMEGRDNVTGATFEISGPGFPAGSVQTLICMPYPPGTPLQIAPVVGLELNLVGPCCRWNSVLSSGSGSINYRADQPLTAEIGPEYINSLLFSGESANSVYYPISEPTGNSIVQQFSTSAAQAVA